MPEPCLGTAAQFATVRGFLNDAGFTEEAIAGRTGVAAIHLFKSLREGRKAGVDLQDQLDLLIRLFMDAEMVPWQLVRQRIPAPVVDSLVGLELITTAGSDPGQCHATALVYPTEGVYIASDLTTDPDPANAAPMTADVVYPAITMSTRRFMSLLPRTPCERFLELCAGTGIAALVAARTAGHAWALDITERATRFARFNAALNGLDNFTALQGDLYQPVAGRTFDRIAAHPPYVPANQQRYIYRDGGADGEQISRGVLAGLPAFLAPGGRFHGTCVMGDRKDARLEQRIRQMLGPEEREFDLLVLTAFEYHPMDYFTRLALDGQASFADLEGTLRQMRSLGVEALVYSHIELQRRTGARPVFTRRRQLGPSSGLAEVEWQLRWESAAPDPETITRLLTSRPRVSPAAAVQITLRPDGQDGWAQTECAVTVDWPFSLRARCPVWAADLLARCDGKVPLGELLAALKAGGVAGEGEQADAALVGVVQILVSAGILVVDGFPLPPRSPPTDQHPIA